MSSGIAHDPGRGDGTPTKQKQRQYKRPHVKPNTPKKKALAEGSNDHHSLQTPTKYRRTTSNGVELTTPSKADRSARKKSARKLLLDDRDAFDGEGLDELGNEHQLAQEIWDEEQEGNAESSDAADGSDRAENAVPDAETPKRGRGRPKGSKKKRTPTPPPDLPAYEHYFFQNRPGGVKTSSNTLSSLSLLNHEEYFAKMSEFKDHHSDEIDFLHSLHSRSFDQWVFELEEGYNICVYGWGSKRNLLMDFAAHVSQQPAASKIVVVNGYNTSLHMRDVLASIASVIPSLRSQASTSGPRLGSQPADVVNTILTTLSATPPPVPHTLLIHSLDSPALRRIPTQSLLALLASSPHIRLVASADTPNFPLLWDVQLRGRFNWLFHDATTFVPFDVELSGKAGGVVDEVNALLGRSGRRVDGREGVMYVLRSLTENARNLFALLVGELLSMEDADDVDVADGLQRGDEEDEFEAALADTDGNPGHRPRGGELSAGIEFRTLYQKATAQFIATNEHAFRAMLKEFYDHEMVIVRKDGVGAEVLSVPFRREELDTILSELMGGV